MAAACRSVSVGESKESLKDGVGGCEGLGYIWTNLSGVATSGDAGSRLEEDLSQSLGDDSHEMADVNEPAPGWLAPADSFRSSSVSHCVSRLMARLILLLFTGNRNDPKESE
jgi:hypothetical protein